MKLTLHQMEQMVSSQNQNLRITVEELKMALTYWVCLGVLEHQGSKEEGRDVYSTISVYEPRQ